jgi:hypothetical protein
MSSNHDYFRMRALEELERAASSDAPRIAAVHQELAEKYQTLVCLMEVGVSSDAEPDRPDTDTFA